ncbi:linker for activation of T-cells family member 2 isoform X2 [Pelodiscus sinensis]|uniref:linker for activation of T-cells family member 2 isoform X2 n=1 Tax=Pelodiscus sinensis TaxID=13735 RepID=UPI003F6B06B5
MVTGNQRPTSQSPRGNCSSLAAAVRGREDNGEAAKNRLMLQAGPPPSNEPSGAALGGGLAAAPGGPATKRDKKLSKHRSRHENQQGFEVIRSYSMTTTRQDQMEWPENILLTRKTSKDLQATSTEGDNGEPRYQNFMRGALAVHLPSHLHAVPAIRCPEDSQELDAAYVSPIATDYYNCGKFLRPPNDDSCSYENMVIGASNSLESDDTEDYENSAAFKTWQQSHVSESPDDDPDYVNSDIATVPN